MEAHGIAARAVWMVDARSAAEGGTHRFHGRAGRHPEERIVVLAFHALSTPRAGAMASASEKICLSAGPADLVSGMLRTAGSAILLLFAVNCMTVATLTNFQERFEPVVYSGVRTSLSYEPHAHNIFGGLIRTLMYVDLPFSLVFDTVVLPVTAPLALLSNREDRRYEREVNPAVRFIAPAELELYVHNGGYSPSEGQRPFPPSPANRGNSDYRKIRLPVRHIEKGIPGCYLHCAAGRGLLSTGVVANQERFSVGLIRVAGVYKRNERFKHHAQQQCVPQSGSLQTEKSSELSELCNREYPACEGSCVAVNQQYTLHYVSAEPE